LHDFFGDHFDLNILIILLLQDTFVRVWCVIYAILDAYGNGTCVHVDLFVFVAGVQSDGLVGEGGIRFLVDCTIALWFDPVDVIKRTLPLSFINYPVHT
jgi:hypothetical protein